MRPFITYRLAFIVSVMLIAFLTSDLIFPSRVAGVATRIGARLETAATSAALISKIESSEGTPSVVLLDLSSSGLEPATTVPRLKSLLKPPRAIIAFGPHVHEAKLAAAGAAGCDLVLTRGQFDAQMGSLLLSFAEERPNAESG